MALSLWHAVSPALGQVTAVQRGRTFAKPFGATNSWCCWTVPKTFVRPYQRHPAACAPPASMWSTTWQWGSMLPYIFDLPPQTADEGSQQLKSQRPPWRIRDQVSARVEVCETRQQNLASCLCVFACETMDLPNHRARSLQRLDCLMGFARATEHNPYGPSGWRVGPLGTLLASGVGLRRL